MGHLTKSVEQAASIGETPKIGDPEKIGFFPLKIKQYVDNFPVILCRKLLYDLVGGLEHF